MTHAWDANNRWQSITRLQLGPCVVSQVKSEKTDGYSAVQLVYGAKKQPTKPLAGHLKAINMTAMPFKIQEVRGEAAVKVGDNVTVSDVFFAGDIVKVTGYTKGRGFSGVVKRWGFKGGPKTHGQSDRLRGPGAIGAGTTPGRVNKGKKMAGRYGQDMKSIKNLKVIKIDAVANELWVEGSVPGCTSGEVTVTILKQAPRPEQSKEATA